MSGKAARWPFPERVPFQGLAVDLEPLGTEHVPELWDRAAGADRSFDYLRYGPFASERELHDQVLELAGRADQPFWVVKPKSSGRAEGWLSLCDIFPDDGAIEIGSIWFAPSLQRTRAATEAIFLLMAYAMGDLAINGWSGAACMPTKRRGMRRRAMVLSPKAIGGDRRSSKGVAGIRYGTRLSRTSGRRDTRPSAPG
jgi:hypothetical protein